LYLHRVDTILHRVYNNFCIGLTLFCIGFNTKYYFFIFMNEKTLTIGDISKKLDISINTLRRWDKSGRLVSIRGKNNYRYYSEKYIEEYIKNNLEDIFKMARNWVLDKTGVEPLSDFYCSSVYVFKARLDRLETELSKTETMREIYALVGGVIGEIGNNSFDHNIGNWPDIRGIFFAYDLKKRKIVLADRGQGILKTLKKVKPELDNNQDALKTAFTEIISGRSPEFRGNGLKFVRRVIMASGISLFFQTGDAELYMERNNPNLDIKNSSTTFHGCLALIKY